MNIFAPIIEGTGGICRTNAPSEDTLELEEMCRCIAMQCHSGNKPIFWMQRDQFHMPQLVGMTAGLSRDAKGKWKYSAEAHADEYTRSPIIEETMRERIQRAIETYNRIEHKKATILRIGKGEWKQLCKELRAFATPVADACYVTRFSGLEVVVDLGQRGFVIEGEYIGNLAWANEAQF